MAKQLNISLAFQADTSQARAQIQGLINELNKISSVGVSSVNTEKLTSEIIEAKMAAKDLGVMLEQSFNVDTGKLDLNKFNSSLKKSGMSLTDYGNKMAMLGTQGDQAFLKIAQSIVETEAPLKRSSGLLKEFGTTLANTARWQISSSILHGFMGSVQKAYGYAQDLNESLNNIRIVTGQNIDQMTVFAERANKAAKALSTTTTDYTNASLIYYQQGLNDQEVQERTDITVKMANVAGQSAETVSDQLTAVWNNFDDGTKSLEHYADVMTALGAATASSTDEIADGLEKFAAVADTVGLSYEYAASALATVTATTRQSADVVGTAFKTLFARIEGLELGETLDDGTTLNKYSEALMAVGVNIKDSNGEMKEMDTILTEMAAKWDTLNKSQQVALAQTVAGVRQYTQLIALMDNWDFMEENLATSANSTGALEEQQKIYEESWAASQDRVKASMEGIFDSVIEDDFFIGLNNALADTLGVVEKLVDAMGGMPGALSLVGILVTSIFKDQLTNGINNAIHNMKNFAGVSQLEMKQLKKEAYEYAQEMIRGLTDTSPGFQRQSEHLTRIYELQELTEEALKGVNAEQAEAIQTVYKQAKAYSEVAVEAGRAADEAQRLYEEQQKAARETLGAGAQKKIQDSADISVGLAGADLIREAKNVENMGIEMGGVGKSVSNLTIAIQEYKAALRTDDETKIAAAAENLRNKMQDVSDAASLQTEAFTQYQNVVEDAAKHITTFERNIQNFQNTIESGNTVTQEQAVQIEKYVLEMQKLGYPVDAAVTALNKYKIAMNGKDEDKKKAALASLGDTFRTLKISTGNSEKAIIKYGISLVKNHKNSNKYRTILSKMGDKLKDVTGVTRKKVIAMKNDEEATKKATEEQEKYAASLKKAQTSIKSFGSGAASAIQGVSSLGMALSSMKGVIDTLSDPDTSGFEKFLSVLTSSSMIIGSLTSGFSQIGKGFKDMANAADGSTLSLFQQVAQMKTAELQEGSFIQKVKEGIAARKLEVLASQSSATAKTIEAGATNLGEEAEEELNEEKQENVKTTLGMVVSAMADAVAKSGEASATSAAAAAQTALNVALGPFIGLLGAIIPLIGTIVVQMLPFIIAAGALALAITGIAYAATAESRALEEAKAREDAAAESAKRVAEEINGINESLNNISSKTKSLEELEKGTLEWYQAFHEVNAEVQALIDKFPELVELGFITMDENGLLGINEEGSEYISQQTIKRQTAANNTSLKAKKNTLQTEIDNDWNNFSALNDVVPNKEEVQHIVAAYQGYGDALFKDSNYMREALKYTQENASWKKLDVNNTATDEQLEAWFKENEKTIKLQADRWEKINQYEQQIIQNRLLSFGSNRSVDSAMSIMDGYESPSISGSGNSKKLNYIKSDGTQDDFNMNRDDENMPQEIKDFMELQGGEYVAQRSGKLVLDINGEEVEFSEEEVYDALGEIYTGQEFEKRLKDNLTQSLGNAVNGLDDVAIEDVVRLDNLNLGFQEAFNGDVEAANEAFQKIVGAYGNTKESLTQLSQDTQYIDMTSAAFQRLAGDASLSGEQMKTAIQELNAIGKIESMGSWFGEQAENLGLSAEEAQNMQDYAKHLMEVADELDNISDDLKTDADAAADLAVEISRMNKGIETLSDNFEDWDSILKKSSKDSIEYSNAMAGMKQAVADVLDVEKDLLSNNFIIDHSEDIEKAANGDAEAIDRLRASMDEEIIGKIKLERPDLTNLDNLDLDVKNKLDEALARLELPDIEVGAYLNDTEFLEAANNLVKESGMSADQANAYFAGIGYEPMYSTTEIEGANAMQVPNAKTQIRATSLGFSEEPFLINGKEIGSLKVPELTVTTQSVPQDPGEADANMSLTAFSGDGTPPTIKGLRRKASGSMNNYSSSNSGGKPLKSGGGSSSSKPKKAELTKKDDVVERYKEIDDTIEDLTTQLSRAEKAADRLWGKDKQAALKTINKLLDQQIDAWSEREKQSKAYLESDKKVVEQMAQEAGVSLTFDLDTGFITNYTEQMTRLWEELAQIEQDANADGNVTEEEQEAIDKKKEQIENLDNAVKQYDDSLKQWQNDIDTKLDYIYQKQTRNFENLNLELEINVKINENASKRLEYELSKIEDDFYSAAEAAALFFGMGENGKASANSKVGISESNLKNQESSWTKLYEQYNTFDESGNRLISDDDFIKGTEQARDAIYDELYALQEIDDFMMNYYGDTLEKGMEELSKYTDRMDHLSNVLEHYNNIISITGRDSDYEAMGIVLEGQAHAAENKMTVAKSTLEMLQQEAAEAREKMLNAEEGSAAAELYKQEYEAALAEVEKAEDAYLASAEEWAEKLKAVLENALKKMRRDLEKELTGGTSFNQMTTTMERMNSLHEEYLTTTNKIYETNKLMNKAQMDIDKTTNDVAKRRLKSFIEETKVLQDKKALSKFELDIQQAKYDLLLAEMALQEAQDAKSVVRLQRDSEGNFGYVYTADSSKIAEAQQQYEDAQNALYNISLDGANKYTEKQQQIYAEMFSTLQELEEQYLNGSFASQAEYRQAVEEAQAYYYSMLEQGSELYNIAIMADSSAAAEHLLGDSNLVANNSIGNFGNIASDWQNKMENVLIPKSEQWKRAVEQHVQDVIDKFSDWEDACQRIRNETVGKDLDDIKEKVEDITDEQGNLVAKITDPENGVLVALKQEFDRVGEVTGAYAGYRDGLKEVIKYYEDFLDLLDQAQTASMTGADDPPEVPSTNNNNNSNSSNNNNNSNSGSSNNNNSSSSSSNSTASTYTPTTKEPEQPKTSTTTKDTRAEAAELHEKQKHPDSFSTKTTTKDTRAQAAGLHENQKHSGSVSTTTTVEETKKTTTTTSAFNNTAYAKYWRTEGFDTGGYTGDWYGSYGKLAFLHKKELVLNEGDTENFLIGLNTMERILKVLDLQAANAQYAGNLNANQLKPVKDSEPLEQNVHIEASFPNATDKNEIEEAFKDIVNLASQYAYRK